MNATKTLLPVKWEIESLASGRHYAFAWGGGLAEAVRTDPHETKAAALVSLRIALAKLGRCPDKSLCNERTEGGRELLAVLS